MLGWEFPPATHGGLGVACFGLAKALAEEVELEVIVPQTGGPPLTDRFRVTGTVRPAEAADRQAPHRYESFTRVERVPVALDPYGTDVVVRCGERRSTGRRPEAADAAPAGSSGELYGPDLDEKVAEYARAVVELARRRDFDLIHAHDWLTFPAALELKRISGKPLVVHVHSLQFDRAGPQWRDKVWEIERRGMLGADRVIPVSRYTGTICTEHYGIDRRKIRPVHNGAEPVRRYRSAKPFPEKLVLFLGRLTAQKGPEFFLEIAERVLARTGNVRFVMAGGGERMRPLVEKGAFRGLGGRFHFTGFLDRGKVAELLSMTDVYCMPSVSEPFGLSALEAAQFGIPAVISRQSGVAEVLRGALTADFRDTTAMAEHIVRLLEDDEFRARVAGEAERDIRAATWERSAENVLAVFRELIPVT